MRGSSGRRPVTLLLKLGLLRYWLVYGLGLRSGFMSAVGAPLLVIGIWADGAWARKVVFVVGSLMGFVCIDALTTGD